MLFVALLILHALAGPPIPIHGDLHPCAGTAFPRIVDGHVVVCNSTGEPIVRIHPETRALSLAPAPQPVDPAGLIPPPMLGSTPVANAHGHSDARAVRLTGSCTVAR